MAVKVCHISTVHGAFDDRIFQKECKALSDNNYDVSFIVSHDKEEIVDGVHINPLPMNDSRIYRFFKKKRLAYHKALDVNADIYHIHDPELISIALKLKKHGKKIVYDVHEDVPVQILNKEWLGNLFLRKLVSHFFNSYEKSSAAKFDGICTVTEDIKNKFSMNKRTVLVRNLPVIGIIDKVQRMDIQKSDKFIVIYAGGLTSIRGIKEIIQAVGLLKGKAELWIMGKWDNNDFKDECMKEDGYNYTKYIGFKPLEEVYSYMKAADLGICTLHPTENHLTSWPVKAFEYMACGLPILMSDFPYWMQTFKDVACFTNPMEPEEIADKIIYIMNNEEERSNMGKTNMSIVHSNFSWESEQSKLFKLYDEILND